MAQDMPGETARDTGDDVLERLQTLVAEGLKRFEFGLRRKVEDATGDQPALMTTDEVPRGFKELVAEYYRSLSKTSK